MVERSEVALVFYLFTRRALALEQRKDNGVEFTAKFVLLKHIVKISGNEFGFELKDSTAECSKDDRVVAIEQGDAIDGTDLIEHHLSSFWGKTAISRAIFKVVGLVTGFEIQSRDRYDGGLERFLTQGETSLNVVSEHCDIR